MYCGKCHGGGIYCIFSSSAKVLVKGEPNVSYICSRYYRAPELIFGATDYTCNIGKLCCSCHKALPASCDLYVYCVYNYMLLTQILVTEMFAYVYYSSCITVLAYIHTYTVHILCIYT